MKKEFALILVAIQFCFLVSCSQQHTHSYSEADCSHPARCSECGETTGAPLGHTTSVGVCERCGEVQGEEIIEQLNDSFADIMTVGTDLLDCLDGVQSLESDAQYAVFCKADAYVAEMKEAYTDLLDICGDKRELERIIYQLQLLENSCPNAIKGNSISDLTNQGILYQLYLRQISSSFLFLSEDMDYLAGIGDIPNPITYFSEVPEMPTPGCAVYGMTYDSKKNISGTIQYMYFFDSNANEADVNADYNLYLMAIGMNNTFQVEISDSYAIVEKDGSMVSAMVAGYDAAKGYYLIVSFHE